MEEVADESFRAGLIAAIPRLRGFARTLAGSHALGDDLVQETVFRAWRGRAGFEPGTRLEAWLFRILRNTHISGVRAAARFRTRDLEDVERTLASADDPSARIMLDDLRRALNGLPHSQREAVLLVSAAGWSYEDAARHVGCAIGTLKSRVFRARKTLAAQLDSGVVPHDAVHPREAIASLTAWTLRAGTGCATPRSASDKPRRRR